MRKFMTLLVTGLLAVLVMEPTNGPTIPDQGTEGPSIRKVEPKGTEGPDIRLSVHLQRMTR
jgi:hypothetical protein